MKPNCNRDPLTCRCWYHQGHVDEPPTPTKPVVTQAALKPCPFCGGAVHLDDASNFLGDTMWTPFCDSDDCGFMLFDRYPTQEEAITAWNTRPVSQAVVSQDLVSPPTPVRT